MWQNVVVTVLVMWAVAATVFARLIERDLKEWRGYAMAAWTRLDERTRERENERRERDQLIRRLARAEAAMDGLRAIAQESAMLAQLDALRADSCWAPLHDEPEVPA